jgi:hypothetical protein
VNRQEEEQRANELARLARETKVAYDDAVKTHGPTAPETVAARKAWLAATEAAASDPLLSASDPDAPR